MLKQRELQRSLLSGFSRLSRFLIRFSLAAVVLGAVLLTSYGVRHWVSTAKQSKPANVLHVGLLDDTPPYCFYSENNQLVGINIDIATELAHRMGMTPKIEAVSFNRLTSGLITGQYDLVRIGSVTPSRGKVVRYIYPDLISSDVLVVHNNLKHLQSMEGFRNQPYKIGVYNGTSYISLLRNRGFEPNMVIYPNQRDVFLAFYKHRVDAIIMAESVAYYIKQVRDPSILILPDKVRTERKYGFALQKSDLALWKSANTAIETMVADGTIADIHKRWHIPAFVNTTDLPLILKRRYE
ncbi:MAG: amino acid ABC transporter substrate-binding protein, partial [Cyanobacteria bacterium HKST-UBA05]|nr:amino acid ABC transporter substrate-binding protein [Cyanobacteria bacterium HKST-UBA05]